MSNFSLTTRSRIERHAASAIHAFRLGEGDSDIGRHVVEHLTNDASRGAPIPKVAVETFRLIHAMARSIICAPGLRGSGP